MTLIDLTHSFGQGMPVYPGDPIPQLEQIAQLGRDGFNAYSLCTGVHVGTHMDAPLHMIAGGQLICDLPVTRFIGRGRLIDARGHATVTPDLLRGVRIGKGDIILVLTGWDRHFQDDAYYRDYPEIAPELARELVRLGVAIVGLDTPSPDRAPFEVHKILLSAQVPIIENLTNLRALLGVRRFEVIALPAKLQSDAASVRVIARLPAAAATRRR